MEYKYFDLYNCNYPRVIGSWGGGGGSSLLVIRGAVNMWYM